MKIRNSFLRALAVRQLLLRGLERRLRPMRDTFLFRLCLYEPDHDTAAGRG